jgi:hypothetical protein
MTKNNEDEKTKTNSTALQPTRAGGGFSITSAIQQLDGLGQIAKIVVSSGFLPDYIKTTSQAATIIWAGQELGLGMMESLQELIVIKGKVAMSGLMMRALIFERCPGVVWENRTKESKRNEESVIYVSRPGSKGREYKYTIKDAEQAGLTGKDTWQKYTSALLMNRNTSQIARELFADILKGAAYTPEEINPDITIDAEGKVVDVPETILSSAEEIIDITEEEIEKEGVKKDEGKTKKFTPSKQAPPPEKEKPADPFGKPASKKKATKEKPKEKSKEPAFTPKKSPGFGDGIWGKAKPALPTIEALKKQALSLERTSEIPLTKPQIVRILTYYACETDSKLKADIKDVLLFPKITYEGGGVLINRVDKDFNGKKIDKCIKVAREAMIEIWSQQNPDFGKKKKEEKEGIFRDNFIEHFLTNSLDFEKLEQTAVQLYEQAEGLKKGEEGND